MCRSFMSSAVLARVFFAIFQTENPPTKKEKAVSSTAPFPVRLTSSPWAFRTKRKSLLGRVFPMLANRMAPTFMAIFLARMNIKKGSTICQIRWDMVVRSGFCVPRSRNFCSSSTERTM